MPNSRLETFRGMVAKDPANVLAHFGLANEAMKEGFYEEALEHLQAYLSRYDDEGNGYSRLAETLMKLGRAEEARAALRQGIEASRRAGHPGMANELEARLDEFDDE